MKKLFKSRTNRIITGVCGGLGEYFKVDPTMIRLILVIICILTGFVPLIIIYLFAALIIPVSPSNKVIINYRVIYRSRQNRKIAGVCFGFAKYFKLDPNLVRLLFVILFFITAIFPVALFYVLAWAIIPENPD